MTTDELLQEVCVNSTVSFASVTSGHGAAVHLATDATHKRAGLSGLACRTQLPATA